MNFTEKCFAERDEKQFREYVDVNKNIVRSCIISGNHDYLGRNVGVLLYSGNDINRMHSELRSLGISVQIVNSNLRAFW